MKLQVKSSGGFSALIDISNDITVLHLKETISSKLDNSDSNASSSCLSITNAAASAVKRTPNANNGSSSNGDLPIDLRLIVRGRILKDEEKLLSEYAIVENDIIHVVMSKSNPTSSKRTIPIPQINQDPFDDVINNPMMETLMSNPQFMRTIMESNPQFQRMVRDMPELQEAMNDPSFFTELSRGAKNPRIRAEMMRNQDRTLANIESMPGGMGHLQSMFKTMSNASAHADGSNTEEGDKRLAEVLLGRTSTMSQPEQNRPNSQALPNPWARPKPFSSGRNIPITTPMSRSAPVSSTTSAPPINPFLVSMFPQSATNPATPIRNPSQSGFMEQLALMQQSINQHTPAQRININEPIEERYREQLNTLRDMGFTNEELNKRAVLAAGGNLDGAVEWILGQNPT